MNHDMSRSAIENGPDIEEIGDGEDPDVCPRCDGAGGWDFSYTDYAGRDVEDGHDCPTCDGTGYL